MTTYTEFEGVTVLESDGHYYKPCPRCTDGYTCFRWVENGRCFKCGGSGVIGALGTEDQARKWAHKTATRRAKAAAKKQAEKAAVQSARDAWYDEHPGVFDTLMEMSLADNRLAHDLIQQEYPFTEKQAALVLRMVEAYKKPKPESHYVGQVGDKVSVSGKIINVRNIEGFYGPSRLIVVDAGGEIVKTFSTARWVWDAEVGQEVNLSGTVKSHEEYNDTKQTLLTRTKVV